MSVSTRRVMAIIGAVPQPFSRDDIISHCMEERTQAAPRKKGGRRARRADTVLSDQDLAIIDRVINALVSGGIMVRDRRRYTLTTPFSVEGTIQVTSRRTGSLPLASGQEVIIRSELLRGARHHDRVQVVINDLSRDHLAGEVTGILARQRDLFLATVTGLTTGMVMYQLLDMPGRVEVSSEPLSSPPTVGDLALLAPLAGPPLAGRQRCEVRGIFSRDDEAFDVRRIVLKHGLPGVHGEYEELREIEDRLPAEERRDRRDFTKLFTVTIDGADAKDFDDAISLERDGDRYRLYVHIADVSAYVRKGSPLDREAERRGTSFYLAYQVIPMLPEALSNDRCSLRRGVKRLTLSVEMLLDRDGNLLSRQFYRGVIKVDRRLTYTEADQLLDKRGIMTLPRRLRLMNELALVLKQKRLEAGSLDLSLRDDKMLYDGHRVKDLVFAERLRSHIMIEEFMLTANVVVSRALREAGIPALYRVHEEIGDDSMDTLKNFLRVLGFNLREGGDAGKNLQRVIAAVAGKPFEQVVNFAVLRALMQAYYGIKPAGHFGLAFPDYTHFTSPIRRYPDLVVHRCLKSLIDRSAHPYHPGELTTIGEESSAMERVAQRAERDLKKLKACRLMENRIGETFDGVVSGLARSGIYVALHDRPIDGMVPFRNLKDDFYRYHEEDFVVIGTRSGRRFSLGDPVTVRLNSVDLNYLQIDFEIAAHAPSRPAGKPSATATDAPRRGRRRR